MNTTPLTRNYGFSLIKAGGLIAAAALALATEVAGAGAALMQQGESAGAAAIQCEKHMEAEAWGGVNLQFGMGEHYLRTGLNYETPSLWTVEMGFWGRLDLTFETGIAYWRSTGSIDNDELFEVTILPLLRWWVLDPFFLEAGVGASVLSDNHFVGKDISTHFQFADQIGAGVRLSESLRLSVRYAHFSNGGIRRPNPGLNVLMASLTYDF